MHTREIIPIKTKIRSVLTLPGSKSITNRAFLCAALSKGKSHIYGALKSDDTRMMLQALKKLDIKIKEGETAIEVIGCGGNFKSGARTVYGGASGTTTRFLTALSVLRKGKVTIKGTKRMRERPMKDLNDALAQLKDGKRVVRIKVDKSSQFLSALLMISPILGPLKIEVVGELVSKPYIDITLLVMKAFGVKVKNNDYRFFEINKQFYKGVDFEVEGDASAASYFSAIHFLHGGSLKFTNLNARKSVQGDINFPLALKQLNNRSPRVIDMEDMPDVAITLACVAPFVKGETKITGLSTLLLKETDRLAALETELKKLGVKVRKTKDSLTVFGGVSDKQQTIDTYDDHRIAMSFAVFGTMVPGVIIENPNCTAKTYPNFWEDLEKMYVSPVKLGKKNLLLTGMRCSGKTFYGKMIARRLGRKFVDLDLELERKEKMKIQEIVEFKGWPYFRKVEQQICSEFSGEKNLVIATGGGVILSPKNMKALKKNSVNIFIYLDTNILCSRIAKDKGRPSLKGKNLADEINEIWEERRHLYLKYADIIWDDTSGSVVGLDYTF